MSDLIDRQAAIDAVHEEFDGCLVWDESGEHTADEVERILDCVPSAEPERLSDDDFETIRIHLSAAKERLCNQHRWKEAEEYDRLIERFMAFALTESERKTERWIPCSERLPEEDHWLGGSGKQSSKLGNWVKNGKYNYTYKCPVCGETGPLEPIGEGVFKFNFCPNCGADMRGEQDESD